MAAYEKGDWVWFNHPEETWIPATCVEGGTGMITVEMEDGLEHQHQASSGLFMPMDEANLAPAGDMVKLGDLHDAAMLHNLRLRFFNDDIFTYIGPILVALNPYKLIPIFTPEFVTKYFEKGLEEILEPHVYELANNAYKNMVRDCTNQSVVISGESGAGKTEETKLCLQFIAEVAKDEALQGNGKSSPEQLLLQSSPILEAMGNAKTVRNNNSSRFGKYMQICFNSKWKIMGGDTIKYLLEKSRVVKCGVGERNYHIFYHLATLPAAAKKTLKIKKSEDFKYCNGGGCTEVEGINDEAEQKEFAEAWENLSIDEQQKQSLYQIVAAILHLGNITFEEDDEGNATVENDDALEDVGDLLQGDPELLETTLTFRNMQSGGRSIVVIPLKVKEAEETKEGLAKAAYSRCFDWVVERINNAVKTEEKIVGAIGVLDIFGFEIFETNSFEQLCINLANEKLQSHFNDHIFKLELKVYEEEGLDVSGISFSDNQPCLDMIEKKGTGVFPMIDEECVVPKGTDITLLQKMQEQHRKNVYWGKPPKGSRSVFVVNHYAGGVAYDVDMFLEKNRDQLQPDIQSFMAESADKFIQGLFPPAKPKRGRQPTLGGQFRKSLQELYNKLMSTDPHFIKCLKTNEVKKPGIFDGQFCIRQITYLGLIEVVNIRRQGYPIRRTPEVFFGRYSVLDESCKDAKAILAKLGTQGQYQMGKTFVFMKDEMFMHMETQRGLRLEKNVKVIQMFLRDELARMKWCRLRIGYLGIQKFIRGTLARAMVEKLRDLVGARKVLEEAIAKNTERWPPCPEKALLTAALECGKIAAVGELEGTAGLLTTAQEMFERIEEEEGVFAGLEAAVASEDEGDIREAIEKAAAIKFEHELVGKGEAILAAAKKKREEEAAAELAAASQAEAAEKKKKAINKIKKALTDAVALPATDKKTTAKKKKALGNAIATCKEFSAVDLSDCDELKEAADVLADLAANLGASDALDAAIAAKSIPKLKKAIAAAEGKADKKLIATATKLMTDLAEKAAAAEVAAAEYEAAVAAKDTKAQEAAFEKCATLGVKGKKKPVVKKKTAVSKAKASKQGRKQMFEDLADKPYAQRLSELEQVFVMSKYDRLNVSEDDNVKQFLKHKKVDLKKPLLKYDHLDDSKALEVSKRSIATFSSMLGYMGEKYHQYPELLASQILQDGIDTPELVDEIYAQCMIQCTFNKTASLKRAWQLLSLCVKTFPPSKVFQPYVEVFFYHTGHGMQGLGPISHLSKLDSSDKDKVIQISQTSLRKLETRMKKGPMQTAPSEEEIKSLRAEQPMMISVYFTDHSFKKFEVDEELTVLGLLTTISTTLKVVMIETYALYDVSTIGDPTVLEEEKSIHNVLQSWQMKVKLGKGRFAKKGIAKHNMVFSKRLYVDKVGEVPSDVVELHLLYTQAKGCVLRGKYAVTDTEALLLAALSLQIAYGDHNPEKHTAGFLRNELIKYIPRHLYSLQKPEVWERDFVATHIKMKSFTEMMSKQAYVRTCQKFRGYGFTFFVAKQSHMPKVPKTIFLGVNIDGVSVFKTADKSVLQQYRFAKLKSWAASAKDVTFKLSRDEGKHTLEEGKNGIAAVYSTTMGEDICKLLKDYALWLARKRKKEKAAKARKKARAKEKLLEKEAKKKAEEEKGGDDEE